MGGRKKFTAKDQSTSADRPKSAPAERIWQGFDGEVDIFGSKLICELAAGSKVSRIQGIALKRVQPILLTACWLKRLSVPVAGNFLLSTKACGVWQA